MFFLDQWYDLGMGIYQFWLGQHSEVTQNILKFRVDYHYFIAGRAGFLTLADSAGFTAPDGVALP